MYRYPKVSATAFVYIEDVFRLISMKNKTLFIFEDFNDHLFVGNSKISNIIKSNKLTQIIDKPKGVTPTSLTLLDLVITNKTENIYFCDVQQETADNDLIGIPVKIRKPKRSPGVIRIFRHLTDYTKENFCIRIFQKTHDFNMILNIDNVNTQVDIFNGNFINFK